MDIVCYRTACPGCYSLPQSLSIADSGYAITELRGRSYLLEWADNPTWGATQELNDGCHPSPTEVDPHDTGFPLAQYGLCLLESQGHFGRVIQ